MSRALAIDVGSSSVRAALYDELGREIAGSASRAPYELDTLPDGGVEVGAEKLVDLVASCIDGALSAGGNVDVVGASCFWHSLLGIAGDGRPVTAVLTWADTRADGSARSLRALIDEQAVHERTGARLHASYLPAKLRYFAVDRPDVFSKVERWMSFAEYLYLELFGEPRCSISMASATGLYDHLSGKWDADLCGLVGVPLERLSTIGDDPAHSLRNSWASRWPALADAPWYPAFGDGACANVGSGCTGRNRIGLTIGTSAALRVVLGASEYAYSPNLWRYAIDGQRSIVGGALNEGGGLLVWLRDLLNIGFESIPDSVIANCAPDAHGLTILPFPTGERSPGWAADARMTISGLGVNTRPVDIVRATLESVTYRLKLIADQLSNFADCDAEIIGSGGALTASPAWAAIIADVVGRTVRMSTEPEAACRGAALLALERAGLIDDVATVPAGVGPPIVPDAQRHERYAIAAARQRDLYRKIVQDS